MNRIEALDRYSFSSNFHNHLRQGEMPKSYEDSVLNNFIRRVNRKRDPIVLDLASGLGTTATTLEDRGIETVRLDISIETLKFNPGRNIQAAFDGLPFKDSSFSAIHFKDALVHVSDWNNLFEELFRILKKRGELLIVTAERQTFIPSYSTRFNKSGKSKINTFSTEEEYVEQLKMLKRKGRMANKEIGPPYYPLRKEWVRNGLLYAGFDLNLFFSWKPKDLEKDWYSEPETRYVYSAIKP